MVTGPYHPFHQLREGHATSLIEFGQRWFWIWTVLGMIQHLSLSKGWSPNPEQDQDQWNSARTISFKVVLSFQFFVHLTCYDDDYYYSNCCYCYYILLYLLLSSWTIGFLIVGGLKSEITKAGPALTGSHWAMLTFPQVTTWCRNCPPKHLENHDKSDAWLTVWGGITWNHLNDMWCCFFLKVADFLFLGPEFLVKTRLQKPANRHRKPPGDGSVRS
jgi:hypothetical protein